MASKTQTEEKAKTAPLGSADKRKVKPGTGAVVRSGKSMQEATTGPPAFSVIRTPAESALQVLGYRLRKSESPTKTLVSHVRNGITVTKVSAVADYAGVEPKVINRIIKLPERTAARKKAEHKPLDTEQSDRLARIARILGLANHVLESKEAAQRWLNKPNRVLGAAPLDLLDTDIGTEQVESVLTRIEYGVYS